MSNFSRNDIKQFFQDTARERLNESSIRDEFRGVRDRAAAMGQEVKGEFDNAKSRLLEVADATGKILNSNPQPGKYLIVDTTPVMYNERGEFISSTFGGGWILYFIELDEKTAETLRRMPRMKTPATFYAKVKGEHVGSPDPDKVDTNVLPPDTRGHFIVLRPTSIQVCEIARSKTIDNPPRGDHMWTEILSGVEGGPIDVGATIQKYKDDPLAWRRAKHDFELMAEGDSLDGVRSQYYPGWENQHFQAVLDAMNDQSHDDIGDPGMTLEEATKLTSRWGTELYGGRGNAMGVSDADLEHAHNDEMGLRFFHPKNDRYGLDDSEDALVKGEVDFYSNDEMERALNHFDHEDDGGEMDMPNLFDDDLVMERKKIRQMIIQLLREDASADTEVKLDVLAILSSNVSLLPLISLYSVSPDARASINAAAEKGEGAVRAWWEQNKADWSGVLSKLKSAVSE